MIGFALLQTSASVLEKSADIAVKDPHGAIITLVSVSVVFTALVVLYIAYNFIGKLSSGQWKIPERKAKQTEKGETPTPEEAAAIALALDQSMNGEVYAAISMALHQFLNETVHDNESYIITIKRRK